MIVKNLPFKGTYGREIGLIMEFTPTRMVSQLAYTLKRILYLYAGAGFVIQTILVHMKFDKVIPEIPEVAINTSAASEHVAEVEHHIRVIKMQGLYGG